MRLQRRLVARRRKDRIGTLVPVLVDGPSDDSPLVFTGRTAGQAPDIDSQVVFTDCDPSGLVPGTLVEARIVGGSGYDLVATPLPVPR
jgi:ribosomal protein S12 methylthiotransferase